MSSKPIFNAERTYTVVDLIAARCRAEDEGPAALARFNRLMNEGAARVMKGEPVELVFWELLEPVVDRGEDA